MTEEKFYEARDVLEKIKDLKRTSNRLDKIKVNPNVSLVISSITQPININDLELKNKILDVVSKHTQKKITELEQKFKKI